MTGNVTTTTVQELNPDTNYIVGVSWWKDFDLYGRRNILDGKIEGPISTVSGCTLQYDVGHGSEMEDSCVGPHFG